MTLFDYINSVQVKGLQVFGMKEKSLDPDKSLNGKLKIFEVLVETKKANGTITQNNQLVRVLDYGTPEEEALPMISEVEDEPITIFRDTVRTYLDNNFVSPARPSIRIDEIDAENETAIVTAYEVNAEDKIQTKRYYLKQEVEGVTGVYIREYIG